MDRDFIDGLIALMKRQGLSELEYEAEGERIRLVLGGATASVPATTSPVEAAAPEAPASSGIEVRAAMPGCFYRAPSPEEPAFVEEGSKVEAGQTLGLLEAMKMFTEVETEQAGVVETIHVENGKMVAKGDLLFTLGAG
ncbi:acetyl-CoA carboxylase [Pelagovum pacificum]|nr:acetyl-CoA carboxylase [Pelagovum pacificum]QQA41905.1 biotin carboxyl carrier domain-containing protein [Pelagovum pacificum]